MRREGFGNGRRGLGSIALAAIVLAGCGAATTPAGSPSGASRAGSRSAARGNAPEAQSADVDLGALLSEVPEYRGQGRNLFDYGRVQAARPEPPPPREPPPVVAPPPPRPSGPPAPRIDLKYAGFVEKTAPGGEKKKYAIFLDGNDILTGAEGDRMSNRYTIVQIGLESVTVSVEGSSATQRIPLRSQ